MISWQDGRPELKTTSSPFPAPPFRLLKDLLRCSCHLKPSPAGLRSLRVPAEALYGHPGRAASRESPDISTEGGGRERKKKHICFFRLPRGIRKRRDVRMRKLQVVGFLLPLLGHESETEEEEEEGVNPWRIITHPPQKKREGARGKKNAPRLAPTPPSSYSSPPSVP